MQFGRLEEVPLRELWIHEQYNFSNWLEKPENIKMLSKFLYFGYGNLFKAKIQMVDLDSSPERQFRVMVRIKDGRKKYSRI